MVIIVIHDILAVNKLFNTDQGAQSTSIAFTDVLKQLHIRISMGGRVKDVGSIMCLLNDYGAV